MRSIFFFFLNQCNTSLVQVMAIATLSSCYNNPMVFKGVVKIRKGQAVTLMMEATNMRAAQTIIAQYSQEVSVLLVFGGTQENRETGTEKTEQREKKVKKLRLAS